MFYTIKNIHFVGIGGSGMSGIAEVLHHSGYHVSGSDIKTSPTTEKLQKLGIPVFIGHNVSNIKEAQVLVVSSAINKHNPEIIEAQNSKIPIIHRSEMLAELMRLKQGVVVAGTHGKTTTTSLLAHALHDTGLDPTVVIGGKLNSFDSNAKLGTGDLFIAEADESDGSFLRLSPAIAVITNIDRDHLDYYGSLDNIVAAFEDFITKIPFYGVVCLCVDDPIVQMILPKVKRKVITFGLRKDADVSVTDIKMQGFTTEYTPVVFGKTYNKISLKMPGLYNVVNSLAAVAVGHILNLDLNKISQSLSGFSGVLHRYSVLASTSKAIVIDDYAHNPKKIQTVLRGTKESFPTQEIIVVFQPHRFSRVKIQFEEFAQCFIDADKLIVLPIYSAGESPIQGLTLESLVQQIKLNSFHGNPDSVVCANNLEDAAKLACQAVLVDECQKHPPKLILLLGAGDVRQVGSMIVSQLGECIT